MRKSLLKTVAATAIVSTVVAVSSVVAMAATAPTGATYSYYKDHEDSHITLTTDTAGTGAVSPTVTFKDGTVIDTDLQGYKVNTSGAEFSVQLSDVGDEEGTLKIYGVLNTNDKNKSEVVTYNGSSVGYFYSGNDSSGNAITGIDPVSITVNGDGNYTFKADGNTGKQIRIVFVTYTNGAEPTPDPEEPDEPSEEDVITDQATLTVSEAIEAITTGEELKLGKFYLLGGVSVDANNFKMEGLSSYTHRVKTNGTSKFNDMTGMIRFTTSGPAAVQVVVRSGSNSEDRDYAILDKDGNTVCRATAQGTSDVTIVKPSEVFNLKEGGTYYIASLKSGINFYSINVVVGNGLQKADDGYTYADVNDTYVIATVADGEETSSSLDINVGKADTITTSTVYEQAVIDGNLITAESLGAKYIYAVKVEGAKGNAVTFTTELK